MKSTGWLMIEFHLFLWCWDYVNNAKTFFCSINMGCIGKKSSTESFWFYSDILKIDPNRPIGLNRRAFYDVEIMIKIQKHCFCSINICVVSEKYHLQNQFIFWFYNNDSKFGPNWPICLDHRAYLWCWDNDKNSKTLFLFDRYGSYQKNVFNKII